MTLATGSLLAQPALPTRGGGEAAPAVGSRGAAGTQLLRMLTPKERPRLLSAAPAGPRTVSAEERRRQLAQGPCLVQEHGRCGGNSSCRANPNVFRTQT